MSGPIRQVLIDGHAFGHFFFFSSRQQARDLRGRGGRRVRRRRQRPHSAQSHPLAALRLPRRRSVPIRFVVMDPSLFLFTSPSVEIEKRHWIRRRTAAESAAGARGPTPASQFQSVPGVARARLCCRQGPLSDGSAHFTSHAPHHPVGPFSCSPCHSSSLEFLISSFLIIGHGIFLFDHDCYSC